MDGQARQEVPVHRKQDTDGGGETEGGDQHLAVSLLSAALLPGSSLVIFTFY